MIQFESISEIRKFVGLAIRSPSISFPNSIFGHTLNIKPKHMKRIFFLAAIIVPMIWSACSGDSNATEDIVPKGMKALDLKKMGYPVKINVPDSSFFPTIDSSATASGAEIRIGQRFDILVNFATPEDADLEKQKGLLAATDAGISTVLSSDSFSLVWETKFGDAAFQHFIHLVKIGKDTYFVRDNNNNIDNQFKKDDIAKMMESAKSLRALPVEKPKS